MLMTGWWHCRTENEAEALRAELQARLEVCGLQMHPTKTQIVYCKDNKRRGTYPNVKFDFLGYSVQAAAGGDCTEERVLLWLYPSGQPSGPEVHANSEIRNLRIPRQTPGTLVENRSTDQSAPPGGIGYYGRFSRSGLRLSLTTSTRS